MHSASGWNGNVALDQLVAFTVRRRVAPCLLLFLNSLYPKSSILDRERLMEGREAGGVEGNRPIRSDYREVSFDSEEAQTSVHSDEGQTPNRGFGIEQAKNSQVFVPEGHGLKKFFAYVGPGFLVAIAYMDPGNFESDLQAGARYRYELLWILLLATIAGTLIQSLASNLGVVTGKHLAEHCRAEYPSRANHMLWLLAEIAIIASDIPEVIGTAYALNLLFQLQLWVGVILTGFSTLFFLALQQFGVRKLEFLIFVLVVTIASCFFVELHYVKPSAKEIFHGLLVPRLHGQGAFGIAISLMGAMVMPHNLYLHSALVLTRKTPRTFQDVKDGCRYNVIESSFALLVSFAINLAVVSVSGAACHSEGLSPEDQNSCKELDLNRASFLLRNALGKWNSTLYGIALLASGQSSTITGTYAGQYVMQGFLELRFAPWIRNMITRCVAILPSLVVSLIGGSRGAGKLIIGSSMILSFELPFALLPLLKFTSNKFKMGAHVNSAKICGLAWFTGVFILLVNIFYLCNWSVHWITTTTLPRPAVVILGMLGSFVLLAYLGFTCYLALRTERTQNYILPDMAESIGIADERINLEVEMS